MFLFITVAVIEVIPKSAPYWSRPFTSVEIFELTLFATVSAGVAILISASFLSAVTTTGRDVTTLLSFNTLMYAVPALTPLTATVFAFLANGVLARSNTESSLDTTVYFE